MASIPVWLLPMSSFVLSRMPDMTGCPVTGLSQDVTAVRAPWLPRALPDGTHSPQAGGGAEREVAAPCSIAAKLGLGAGVPATLLSWTATNDGKNQEQAKFL